MGPRLEALKFIEDSYGLRWPYVLPAVVWLVGDKALDVFLSCYVDKGFWVASIAATAVVIRCFIILAAEPFASDN